MLEAKETLAKAVDSYNEAVKKAYENDKAGKFSYYFKGEFALYKDVLAKASHMSWAAQKVLEEIEKEENKKK